jgi:hypothetical protein
MKKKKTFQSDDLIEEEADYKEFPDEMETPFDKQARIRFRKYVTHFLFIIISIL